MPPAYRCPVRHTYVTLYRLGVVPWDRPGVPAPLAAVVDELAPGTAVDLGCGTGGQALYLADHGWAVTAVDYVARAVALARRPGWAATVTGLAGPAAVLLVRAQPPGGRPRGAWRAIGPTGMSEAQLTGVLGPAWTVQDHPAPSWYRLVRS